MFKDIIARISFIFPRWYVVVILVAVSSTGVVIWRWWKQKYIYKDLFSLPSPQKHWLLGNILQELAALKQNKYFQLLFDWSKELGPIYVCWSTVPCVVLSNPKTIEKTIINGMRDGSLVRSQSLQKIWNDIGGPILLGLDGNEWQWRRKAWNPEFSATGVFKYIGVIQAGCSDVIEKVREAKPSEVIQVDSLFVELTIRVIFHLTLGIPVDKKKSSLEGPPLDIEKVYEAMSAISYWLLRTITVETKWLKYLPTQSCRDYWSAKKYLKSFLAPRVELALQLRDKKPSDLEQVSPWFLESILMNIVAKEPKYNRETLISELIVLLMAAIDTTAHFLSFTVGELALNPKVFQQAQSVVDKAWPKDSELDINVLKQLDYIRAILKETMRLYSVLPGSSPLHATRDTIIEGINVPKGSEVFWSIFAAGRDPEIYSQPEEFLPERWLEGEGCNSLPMIYFGSGYHRCLGEHLVMLESTIMLAHLLRYFRWELVNGRSSLSLENIKHNLFLYPPDGMPLRFHLR